MRYLVFQTQMTLLEDLYKQQKTPWNCIAFLTFLTFKDAPPLYMACYINEKTSEPLFYSPFWIKKYCCNIYKNPKISLEQSSEKKNSLKKLFKPKCTSKPAPQHWIPFVPYMT